MSRPVGRIEVWEPGGGAALYTIDDATGIYYKEVITSGIGNFNFTCYSHKDFSGTYTYPNIDLGDTVKIWLDWDTIAGNPNFIGKVTKRVGPLLTETGWVRKISGLSQGEILLRRQKKNKYYDATAASTIVTEWANDLSLGTGDIQADATAVTLEVRTKNYFDLMREISDYWVNAGSQIKKDFWVDLDGDLYWHTRPFRSVGVESFTTADFLSDPLVVRELEPVKNSITVYGAADQKLPNDESWTEETTDWTADIGTVDRSAAAPQVGTWLIQGHTGVANKTYSFKRALGRVTIRDINTVCFWRYNATQCSGSYVTLRCPDAANYVYLDLGTANDWSFKELALGPNEVYDAAENPNGIWTSVGSPNWWDIQYIQFSGSYAINDKYPGVDGLYFFPDRSVDTASDATSITAYGQRDLEVTDDKLHSEGDCQKRAETLLYQLKDPPTQITIKVLGNDNVLVGDRLPMTIPSESISAASYDIIAVENLLDLENWTTMPTMVNSANWRSQLDLRQQVETRRFIRQLMQQERTQS